MGKQKTPYQKTYEIKAGLQEFTVDFKGCNRQFARLEVSLVYNKSNKHSYKAECTAKNKKRPASEYFRDVQCNQQKKTLTHRLVHRNIYFGTTQN